MPKKPYEQLSKKQKDKIARVCFRQLARHGYANTSIKMITRQLKVADGYLYYYFDGKEDLAGWIIDRGMDSWIDHHNQCLAKEKPRDLFELFKASVLQMARFIHEQRDVYVTYFQLVNEPHFPLTDYLTKRISWIDDIYKQAIEDEIASGNIRSDVMPELVAMLLDVVNTRIQEFIYNPALDPIGVSEMDEEALSELVDSLISVFKNGLHV